MVLSVNRDSVQASADLHPVSLAISSHVSGADTIGSSGVLSQDLQHHSLAL
ncbi:hypothetical protein D3C72_2572240 [compost metagenome]